MKKYSTEVVKTENGYSPKLHLGCQSFLLQEKTNDDLQYTEGLSLEWYASETAKYLAHGLEYLCKKEPLKIELQKEKPYLLKNKIIVNGEELHIEIGDTPQMIETLLKHLGHDVTITIKE